MGRLVGEFEGELLGIEETVGEYDGAMLGRSVGLRVGEAGLDTIFRFLKKEETYCE